MEFLKEILGEELYTQVESKINTYNSDEKNKDKQLKLVNLSSGNYVGKEKFDAKETEVAGLTQQLNDANATIKSYEDMDVEAIKQSVKDWETKYNEDTANLQKQLTEKDYEYNLDLFLNGLEMVDEVHKENLKKEIKDKQLKFENKKLIGGDDVVAGYKEKYPQAFAQKEEKEEEQEDLPAFVGKAKGPLPSSKKAEKDMTYEDYCKLYPMK